MFAHKSSKTRSAVRLTFLAWEMRSFEILGCFTLKTPLKWVGITNQNKMSNNFETVTDMLNKSMNNDYETVVAVSESIMNKCMQGPLAEDWRWCHIRLAIKPRYLGNHAWQLKSYDGSPWRSHGRFFSIRHEKVCAASRGGGLTMTSYPACNRTSLFFKPYIPVKKLLWITIRKSWSLFQNPSWKDACSTPWRINHDDVISSWQ